jgi:hypothetical protein
MPYFLLKNALRVSNPIGMIRSAPATSCRFGIHAHCATFRCSRPFSCATVWWAFSAPTVSLFCLWQGSLLTRPAVRMFTSTLSEEVKVLQEDIEAVKDKVEDAVMCEKVRQFVYASKDIQSVLKADAGSSVFYVRYQAILPNETLKLPRTSTY